jgi:hypothetical protein
VSENAGLQGDLGLYRARKSLASSEALGRPIHGHSRSRFATVVVHDRFSIGHDDVVQITKQRRRNVPATSISRGIATPAVLVLRMRQLALNHAAKRA